MGETIYIVRSTGDGFDTLTAFTDLEEAKEYAGDERSNGDSTVITKSFEWHSGQDIA